MPFDTTSFVETRTSTQIRLARHLAILTKAREMLAKGRWIQGAMHDGINGRCAVGWLDDAAKATGGRLRIAPKRVFDHFPLAYGNFAPDKRTALMNYNDMRSRMKKEVIALFDAAIDRVKCKL